MSPFEKHPRRSGSLLSLLAAVILAVTLATASLALAQTPQGPSDPVPAEAGSEPGTDQPAAGATAEDGPTDAREVEAFMDGFVAHQLEDYGDPRRHRLGGQGRRGPLRQGLRARPTSRTDEPVVADETLFRIASTSKLFTATAVMQLVGGGEA